MPEMLGAAEDVAVQTPAPGLQLLADAEQVGVVGHIKEILDGNTPRVAIWLRLVP